MKEKELTGQESIKIITQMIEKTKKEAVDIKSFLILGYPLVTGIIALAIMHACLNIPNSMMWFSCFNVVIIFIVGLWVVARQTNKERKQNSSVSYTDKIVHCVVAVNWYANIILSMAMFFCRIHCPQWRYRILPNPFWSIAIRAEYHDCSVDPQNQTINYQHRADSGFYDITQLHRTHLIPYRSLYCSISNSSVRLYSAGASYDPKKE